MDSLASAQRVPPTCLSSRAPALADLSFPTVFAFAFAILTFALTFRLLLRLLPLLLPPLLLLIFAAPASITGAFGKLNTDKKTRTRAGSVLAKYSPTSNTAADCDAAAADNDAVMDNGNNDDSDSISNSGFDLDE